MLTVFFNRSTGEAILCQSGFEHVADEMIGAHRAENFERLTVGNVLHVRAIDKGHLSVTTVDDGTL